MRAHRVIFTASAQLSGTQDQVLGPILARWPGGVVPHIESATIPRLLGMLERFGSGELEGEPPSCVVLAISKHESAYEVDRCVSELLGHGLPGVVLAEDAPRLAGLQEQGVMVLPMSCEPQVAAAMIAALCERQQYVTTVSRELALAMRCQEGIRAEIERLHEELHLAASVQQDFTAAPLPRLEALDFGVLFRPVNAVSGDIYSVRDMGGGWASFFVADAVGHGVPAALLTMVLTNSLVVGEETPIGQRPRPMDVMARLNRRLMEGALGMCGRFATGVYGLIDSATRSVTIAGAGHPPPIVLSHEGVRTLATDGPLLGIFPDAEFTQSTTILKPGETLIVHTDGLEHALKDAGDGSACAHVGELEKLFQSTGSHGPTALVEGLEELIDEQAGSLHQGDDVTVLAIRAALKSRAKAA
jgi:serine phosphatase RsbU (regulator of sigma subunit)